MSTNDKNLGTDIIIEPEKANYASSEFFWTLHSMIYIILVRYIIVKVIHYSELIKTSTFSIINVVGIVGTLLLIFTLLTSMIIIKSKAIETIIKSVLYFNKGKIKDYYDEDKIKKVQRGAKFKNMFPSNKVDKEYRSKNNLQEMPKNGKFRARAYEHYYALVEKNDIPRDFKVEQLDIAMKEVGNETKKNVNRELQRVRRFDIVSNLLGILFMYTNFSLINNITVDISFGFTRFTTKLILRTIIILIIWWMKGWVIGRKVATEFTVHKKYIMNLVPYVSQRQDGRKQTTKKEDEKLVIEVEDAIPRLTEEEMKIAQEEYQEYLKYKERRREEIDNEIQISIEEILNAKNSQR